MVRTTSEDTSWIGQRITDLRHAQGWTLAQLAARVDLSGAQLSRIESGARQPSVGTLIELARSFGVSLSELVAEPVPARHHTVRAHQRRPIPSANGTLSLLSGPYPALEAMHLCLPPGETALEASHDGEEWIYVLHGPVEVRVGEATEVLKAGDAIHFPSRASHGVHNLSDKPAEILLTSTSTTHKNQRSGT